MDMLQGASRARTRQADQKIDLTKLNVVDRHSSVCFNDRTMNTFILKLEQQDDDNDEVRNCHLSPCF